MAKIAEYDTKPKLIPSTKAFFNALAKTSEPPMSTYFYNLANSTDPAKVAEADREISSRDTLLHSIMRNTIAPVFLKAGFRGNVIPGSAEATLNFRTIPGTDPEDLIREIKQVIDDPRVEVTTASMGMNPAMAKAYASLRNMPPSTEDSELYRILTAKAKETYPGAEVTPYLFQAGTDAFPWRSKGIPVYGIYPYPITAEDLKRMHGNDERVPVESLATGTQMIYKTLLEVAAKK